MKKSTEPSTYFIASNLLRAGVALLIALLGMLWFLAKWLIDDFGSALPIGIITLIVYIFVAPAWLLSKDSATHMEEAGKELIRRLENRQK